MSVIGFREWEIWQNSTYFSTSATLHGQYSFSITPSLMAQQTIDFLYEQVEQVRLGQLSTGTAASAYLSPLMHHDGTMTIHKVSTFSTSSNIGQKIATLLEELRALSLYLDFSLTCNSIEYSIPPGHVDSGKVFWAARRSMIRGLAFEVGERSAASENLCVHFDDYNDQTKTDVQIAAEHYNNGMTLLGLEDRFTGLLDAAFMQFYQGCEAMCGYNHKVTAARKFLASNMGASNSKDISKVLEHVWKVRNKYFAHRGQVALLNANDVYQVAKQVLVARWLCRRLIDARIGTAGLCREMRLYHGGSSEEFRGDVQELDTTFKIP